MVVENSTAASICFCQFRNMEHCIGQMEKKNIAHGGMLLRQFHHRTVIAPLCSVAQVAVLSDLTRSLQRQ